MAKASSCTKVMVTLHSSLLIHCSESILHLPEVASAVLHAVISCQLSAAAGVATVWIPRFGRNNFPAVLCRRCPQSFVLRCMWPDYRRLIYLVLLKRHFKELVQYSPQLSEFRGASNLVIMWFDSLNSRADRRESFKTRVIWYFHNAISEDYSLLSYDAALLGNFYRRFGEAVSHSLRSSEDWVNLQLSYDLWRVFSQHIYNVSPFCEIQRNSKRWTLFVSLYGLNSKRHLTTRQIVGCGIPSSLLALRVDLRGLRSKLSWIRLTFSSDTRRRPELLP